MQINETNFESEVIKNNGLALIDFWAPWCGPCRILGPIIEDLANDVTDVKIGKVNVDENPMLAGSFGVRSIPTVILFKDGKPVEQIVGVRGKEDFIALIDKHR
jgi:thioredoxin 1